MSQQKWSQIILDLRGRDAKRAVLACEKLARSAGDSHIPGLYDLLKDDSFFVREAAAVPLARLEGIDSLPSLLQAMSRGLEDGHDNDGLVDTIASLLETNREKATPILLKMVEDENKSVRANAAWALGFVASQITPVPLIKLIDRETSLEVRAAAVGSLSSFKGFPEVYDKLISLLPETDLHFKIAVVSALGYLGDRRAIQPLRALQQKSTGAVQDSIRFALEQLDRVKK
jgi:HEAT repeat protein